MRCSRRTKKRNLGVLNVQIIAEKNTKPEVLGNGELKGASDKDLRCGDPFRRSRHLQRLCVTELFPFQRLGFAVAEEN